MCIVHRVKLHSPQHLGVLVVGDGETPMVVSKLNHIHTPNAHAKLCQDPVSAEPNEEGPMEFQKLGWMENGGGVRRRVCQGSSDLIVGEELEIVACQLWLEGLIKKLELLVEPLELCGNDVGGPWEEVVSQRKKRKNQNGFQLHGIERKQEHVKRQGRHVRNWWKSVA